MNRLDTNLEHRGVYVGLKSLIETRSLAQALTRRKTQGRTRSLDGAHASRKRGRGMTFSEVRPYQAGDDIRSIDWRVTARTQETYTKLFEEEKERPVYLLIDQRSSMFFGSRTQFKSSLAAELAAVLAWATLRDQDSLAALIFGDTAQDDLRPSKGKRAILRFLKTLSDCNQRLTFNREEGHTTKNDDASAPRQQTRLSDMLQELRRVVRPGAQVYILSDFDDMDSDCERNLSLIARHNDIELLHVSDPLERSLPNNAHLTITDGSQRATLNTFDSGFRQRYRQFWHARLVELTQLAQKKRVVLKCFSTETPLAEHIPRLLGVNAGVPLTEMSVP